MIKVDEVDCVWRRATHSNAGTNCVEVAVLSASIGIRDSKHPDKPGISVSAAVFAEFIGAIKDGGDW